MTIVVPNVGEELMIKHIVGKTVVEDLILKLYKNNITPGESDTAGTYTVSDFTGYSNVTLSGASWTTAQGAPSSGSYAQQTFASSADQASQTAYGIFIVGASSGTLYYAERFANPPVIANNGDSVKYTPNFTLD